MRDPGCYCFVCRSPGTREEGPEFVCPNGHRAPRAFLFDGKAVFQYDDRGRLIHETVGALIRRSEHVLLFLRAKFPFAYTIPAGHLEIGKDPAEEVAREVAEETGLIVRDARFREKRLLHDPCRRGADHHLWHLYEVRADGEPRLCGEGRIIGWYRPDEVRHLTLTEPLQQILPGYLGLA